MKRTKKTRKKRSRLVLRLIVIVLASLFVGGGIYTINAKRVMHNLMPMPLGVGTAVVLTGSMEPALSANDLVLVRSADSYEVGDIVVYQSANSLVIHRIVSLKGETVITQGDANNAADDPISLSAIKGKLFFSVPLIGALVRVLQTLPGILIVCILAFLLLHFSRQKEQEDDDQKLDAIKAEIRRLKEASLTQTSEEAEDSPRQSD